MDHQPSPYAKPWAPNDAPGGSNAGGGSGEQHHYDHQGTIPRPQLESRMQEIYTELQDVWMQMRQPGQPSQPPGQGAPHSDVKMGGGRGYSGGQGASGPDSSTPFHGYNQPLLPSHQPRQHSGGSPTPADGKSDAWVAQMMGSLWIGQQGNGGSGGGSGSGGNSGPGGASEQAWNRSAPNGGGGGGMPPSSHNHSNSGGYMSSGGRGGGDARDGGADGPHSHSQGFNGGNSLRVPLPKSQQHEGGAYGDNDGGYSAQSHFRGRGSDMGGGRGRGGRGRGGFRGGGGGGYQHGGGSSGHNHHGGGHHHQAQHSSNIPVAVVEFKRQRLKKFECPPFIQPGQYVLVDGDRGQDCGLVVHTACPGPDGVPIVQTMEGSSVNEPSLKVENGRVLRVAEQREIALLHGEIASLERSALKGCRQRAEELKLPIEVVDCEFQFDRKKVSFYFESSESVDFRELVKDLYRLFGARIWMENINANVKNVVPAGALSHQQKAGLRRAHQSGGGPDPTPRVGAGTLGHPGMGGVGGGSGGSGGGGGHTDNDYAPNPSSRAYPPRGGTNPYQNPGSPAF